MFRAYYQTPRGGEANSTDQLKNEIEIEPMIDTSIQFRKLDNDLMIVEQNQANHYVNIENVLSIHLFICLLLNR